MSKLLEKLNKIIDEAKIAINDFSEEEAEVTLERSPVPELEIIIEWNEIGEPVNSVVSTEDGEETLEPVADGEFVLEDGRILVVAEGVLSEIKDAATEEEPSETEESKEEDLKVEDETKEEVKAEVEDEPKEEVKAEEETDKTDAQKSLEELIDLTTDGYYTIEVGVENGAISYGGVYANTWKELQFKLENFEQITKDKEDLENEVEALKAKIKEPITDPKLGFEKGKEVEDEIDVAKLSGYQKKLHKLGLPIV